MALVTNTAVAVEQEAKAPAPKAAKTEKAVAALEVTATVDLLEPKHLVRLPAGIATLVPELTEWLKCQKAAGLVSYAE